MLVFRTVASFFLKSIKIFITFKESSEPNEVEIFTLEPSQIPKNGEKGKPESRNLDPKNDVFKNSEKLYILW